MLFICVLFAFIPRGLPLLLEIWAVPRGSSELGGQSRGRSPGETERRRDGQARKGGLALEEIGLQGLNSNVRSVILETV